MALNKAAFSTSSIPEGVIFFFDVEVVDKNVTYQCRKCSDYMKKFTSKKAQFNPLGFTREKYISDKEFSVFRWLEWVVMRNMPLSVVDNPLTRSLAGHDSIFSNCLATYITRLVSLVQASIRKTLPAVLAL
ncbi:hypothetical protein L915_13631 [Phytophthora nicotianae]|uniref:Uncharacterized protein n=1 Tax=Phytophthora nicotianae TaxID=4792 RepID=W2GEW0_PHYNI|nr:hypothetical protein L915_13631 [Phytophthora nicotianae]